MMYETYESVTINNIDDFFSKKTIIDINSFIKDQSEFEKFIGNSAISIEITNNKSTFSYSTFGEFITDFSTKDNFSEFSIFYKTGSCDYFHIFAKSDTVIFSLKTESLTKAQADDLIVIMYDYIKKSCEQEKLPEKNDDNPNAQIGDQVDNTTKENKPWYKSGVFWGAAGAIITLIGIAVSVLLSVFK